MAGARPLSTAFAIGSQAARSVPSALSLDGDSAVARHDDSAHRGTTEDLELVIGHAIQRARGAWPTLDVADEEFATFLGARIAPDAIADCRVEDLWAVCCCARSASHDARPNANDARTKTAYDHAIATVEARYFPDVESSLAKMGLHGARIDEVKQGLRQLLFVGDPATRTLPRIVEYRGSGDLRAWLRVTAMRAALKLLRKDGRERPTDDALLEATAPADDPELAYMKAAYRAAFKAAFQEALESLLPRERMFLKQQIVDGLSVDDIGALYQVHRATAARWVAAAREKLLGRTRRVFMMRARISSDECESIMRLVRSQLDVSLHRRLAAG